MAFGTTSGAPAVHAARRQTDRVAKAPALGWLARAGLVSRAAIYAIIGILALKLALGDGGKAANQQGALRAIAQTSFGTVLLVLMAIGLAGYAVWRLVRAAVGRGAEQHDTGASRVAALASGVVYGALCVTAIEIVAGTSTSSGTPEKPTGGVLGWPGGTVLVTIAGVALIGVAVYQAYKGLTRKFLEDSKTQEMAPAAKRAFTVLGVVGHLARAVIFLLVAFGLIRAAIDYNPQKAVGLDGALRNLARASYGPVLLGIVAAGLVAFAAYSLADARYRRV
jgi:hypothetical protein